MCVCLYKCVSGMAMQSKRDDLGGEALCTQSDYVYFKIALSFVIYDDDIKSRCR